MFIPTRHMADVSSNNSIVNIPKYASAGHTRIAIKATEATGYVNPGHHVQAAIAHGHGLCVSHYHFCRPGVTAAVDEMRHFWDTVRSVWEPGDNLHIDLEVEIETLGQRDLAEWHNRYCANLYRISGVDCIPYMNEYYYGLMRDYLDAPKQRYWIAAYGSQSPRLKHGHELWAWQFTDGRVGPEPHFATGIGDCDLSLVNRGQVLADYRLSLRRRRR